MSTQPTLRRDINPRWWQNCNLVLQCRQVRRVFRLDITELDNPQKTDQALMLGLSFVYGYHYIYCYFFNTLTIKT